MHQSVLSADSELCRALLHYLLTAGIKTLQPAAGKWGREVDCHTQNNAFSFFFALEMQLKCNLKQQGSTPSTPPGAHLLQPAPLHLHRQMIAKSIRRDIKPPAPGLSQPLTSRVRKKLPSGRLFPNSDADFCIFCTFPWKLG